MNSKHSLFLLALIPVFITGALLYSNVSPDLTLDSQEINSSNPFITEIGLTDNVEFVLTDSDGQIKQTETTHNKFVTHGENCVAKMIFGGLGGDTVGTTVCTGALNAGFSFIQIGESATAVADTDINLVDEADETGLTGYVQGTLVWTNSTTGSYDSVIISNAFTNAGASETINEAGMFNSTTASTNGMLARVVAPSPFVVANGDTLTVNWTFRVGSATVP